MPRVLVTGTDTYTGRALLPRLVRHGYTPVAAVGHPDGSIVAVDGDAVADHAEITVDLETHSSISSALDGIDAVIHASDVRPGSHSHGIDSTRSVAAACADRGTHLVFVSRIGADTSAIKHRRQLWECEQLIERTANLPWTIQRVSHPHPSIDALLDRPVYALPAGTPLQPVSPDDIAGRVVGLVQAGPSRRVRDFAGPELLRFADLAHIRKQERGESPRKIPFPKVGVFAEALDGIHVSQTADRGYETYRDWLRA